jgi:hypothetical protein
MKAFLRRLIVPFLYSIIISSGPFYGWSKFKYEADDINCSTEVDFRSAHTISYGTVILLAGFVFPLIAMLTSNLMVIHKAS